MRDLLQTARADAIGPLLVFLQLLKCDAECVTKIVWLILSISRRIRTRLPTWRSVGLGNLLAILISQHA